MSIRISPWLVLPVAVIAAGGGWFFADRTPASAATPVAESAASGASVSTSPGPVSPSAALPPNHPAMGDMGGHGGAGAEPPAITWTAPPAWSSAANPNPMRIATYKVDDATELSVTRAGGSIDANVQRWASQFDGAPKADRTEKTVHGLKVTIVRLAGTYLGGGMGGSGATDKKEGFAMLAAVVEAPETPYFFKLIGPAAQVDHARNAFDGLVASIAPSAPGGAGPAK
jgi:hypothetical protein